MANPHGPLRVGVGGPVGSGKTALMDALCKALRERYEIAAITNDIYTEWDAEYLVRSGALPPERIAGVETGGCPHTAIREDASINLAAVDGDAQEVSHARPDPDRVGRRQPRGDLLAGTRRSHAVRHRRRRRRQDPIEGRPGHHPLRPAGDQQGRSGAHVGASLEVMDRDAKRMRGTRPFVFTNLRAGEGVDEIARFIEDKGGLRSG